MPVQGRGERGGYEGRVSMGGQELLTCYVAIFRTFMQHRGCMSYRAPLGHPASFLTTSLPNTHIHTYPHICPGPTCQLGEAPEECLVRHRGKGDALILDLKALLSLHRLQRGRGGVWI